MLGLRLRHRRSGPLALINAPNATLRTDEPTDRTPDPPRHLINQLLTPYVIRADDTTVEVWAGKRIQPGKETADAWQSELKGELREAFLRLDISSGELLAGHYNSTSPAVADTENSLFTNMNETMPSALFTALRFERGTGTPPLPPNPIDLISGHLHYYRYTVGGPWTMWEPDRTLARWQHIPRRVSVGTDTARPVWFALRQANADGRVSVLTDDPVGPGTNFGLRITVHTTPTGSHRPTSNSEFVIDGAIAAFHNDQLSDALVAAVIPKLPTVTDADFRHSMSLPCAAERLRQGWRSYDVVTPKAPFTRPIGSQDNPK